MVAASPGLREPLAALAGLSVLVLVVGLVGRWGVVVQASLSLAVAAYGVYLLERGDADPFAPLYAGGLFVAAELAYDTIEPRGARGPRALLVAVLGLAAAGTALLFLGTAGLSTGGLLVEIVGVAAAAAALGLLARLVWAARES